MKMEQSVPKRRHLNSRRRIITQKKAYNIQNTAKAWNQDDSCILTAVQNSPIFVETICPNSMYCGLRLCLYDGLSSPGYSGIHWEGVSISLPMLRWHWRWRLWLVQEIDALCWEPKHVVIWYFRYLHSSESVRDEGREWHAEMSGGPAPLPPVILFTLCNIKWITENSDFQTTLFHTVLSCEEFW
jgi:hypothetical protein